jgi:arginyl-tRNA synthetase
MLFDPKESIDLNGNTGPFIQYAFARIQSVLRNCENLPGNVGTEISINNIEIEIIQHILDYSHIIQKAGKEYSPALLANYIYELVKMYNSFYQTVSILKEEDESKRFFRILLSKKVGEIIESGMSLLGVKVPNRM